jgi:hypothetical protein
MSVSIVVTNELDGSSQCDAMREFMSRTALDRLGKMPQSLAA